MPKSILILLNSVHYLKFIIRMQGEADTLLCFSNF